MLYKSIAVTGGNGSLGRAIVEDLSVDAKVTSVDVMPGRPGVRSRYADVLCMKALGEALSGHDAIVHVSALLLPEDPQDKMFQVNVVGTWNVLQVAEQLGIRKVVIMSSECSSGIININRMPQARPQYLPIDEDHPLSPLETYGLSKQLNEITAQCFARRGAMQIVALRPTLILTPGMEEFVQSVRERDDPDLWSYVELRDVVRATRLALDYDQQTFDCFYLSASDTYSREETLAFMERKFGMLPEIRQPDLYRDNPHAAIWDLSRSRELLGFEPESDWRQFISNRRSSASDLSRGDKRQVRRSANPQG